jgi:hypothetical protein
LTKVRLMGISWHHATSVTFLPGSSISEMICSFWRKRPP